MMKAHLRGPDPVTDISSMTLLDMLQRAAFSPGSEEKGVFYAGVDGDMFQSYSDIYVNAEIIAARLISQGINRGDTVILQIRDIYCFINLFWGCLRAGIIPVPVTANRPGHYRRSEYSKLIAIARECGKTVLLAEDDIWSSVSAATSHLGNVRVMKTSIFFDTAIPIAKTMTIEKPDRNDIAFIQYTSGTTGRPKGVLLTHFRLLYNMQAMSQAASFTVTDRFLNWLPLSHDMGMIGYHLTPILNCTSQIHLSPDLFLHKPLLYLSRIASHNATIIGLPPFAMDWLRRRVSRKDAAGCNLTSVRLLFTGAETIDAGNLQNFQDHFDQSGLSESALFPVYGMAEACLGVAFPEPGQIESFPLDSNGLMQQCKNLQICDSNSRTFSCLSVGRPVPGMEILIISRQGRSLKERQIGEIVIRGANVTSGYFRRSLKKRIFTNGGFLKTGDMGFVHLGKLYVLGRKKQMIKKYGGYIPPQFLENLASGDDRGLPFSFLLSEVNDSHNGRMLVSFIQYRNGPGAFSRAAVEAAGVIGKNCGIEVDILVPVKRFPRTTSGKIQRYKLVESFYAGEFEDDLIDLSGITREDMPIAI
jgi:fengycin family lipopeptide synthetase D